jgi:hypothetical protein
MAGQDTTKTRCGWAAGITLAALATLAIRTPTAAAAPTSSPAPETSRLASGDPWVEQMLYLLNMLCIIIKCDPVSSVATDPPEVIDGHALSFIAAASQWDESSPASQEALAQGVANIDDARDLLVLAPWMFTDPVRAQLDGTLVDLRAVFLERLQE